MILQLVDICKSFGVDEILNNVSLKVENGEKVGLIGANGAGKTTLLKIISKEMSYDSGAIYIAKDAKIGFLKQSGALNETNTIWNELMGIFDYIVALEKEMREYELMMPDTSLSEDKHKKILSAYGQKSESFEKQGGFELRAKIMNVLNGMGFGKFDLNMEISKLSGGEKTKLALVKLLLEQPDILLLDEPTNHLDFNTMMYLEGFLRSYRGAVLVVSHDRYFLDKLVDTIYEVERTKAVRYAGNYSKYLELKKQNRENDIRDFELQQKEIKRLEEYVAKNIARASTSKSAKSKQKVIDKIEVMDRPMGDLRSRNFHFEIVYPSYKDVLTATDMGLMVRENDTLRTLVKNVSFDIKRGEKIALIGENGIGKSTLIKTLLNIHKDYTGSFKFGNNVDISYYDQQQKNIHDDKTVLDEIWDRVPRMDESDVRTLLGNMMFLGDDVFKKVSSLSGGERAALEFLIIMLEKSNTLFLDEPTNHLDLPSKEALDMALKNYEGTIFFVSHDRYFLNKVADKIYELTSDGIITYYGNYDEYVLKSAETSANTKEKNKSENQLSYEEEKKKQSQIKSVQKKLQNAENNINLLEEEIKDLKERLENAGSDYDLAREMYESIENRECQLLILYEEFDLLSDELDKLVIL